MPKQLSMSNSALTYILLLLVGASSSDITQTLRLLESPNGEITTTCTKIAFNFFEPRGDSPYQPLPGMTLDEATRALLTSNWPYDRYRAATPLNLVRSLSPITITTESASRSSSPSVWSQNKCHQCPCHSADHCDETIPEAKNIRRAMRKKTLLCDRWYAITRGLQIGVVQGS